MTESVPAPHDQDADTLVGEPVEAEHDLDLATFVEDTGVDQ